MKASKRILLIPALSLFFLLAASFGMYRLLKGESLLPEKITRHAGVMYFEGEKKALVNQPLVINVMIDTNNQNVNAAGFYLKFDSEKISVTNVNTLSSFCQYYPEKKFDNRLGIVSLACGSPHPGFKGKNQLIQLTLTPLSIGTTVLRVTPESKILLSDGKGTNILTEFPSWEVQIGAGL